MNVLRKSLTKTIALAATIALALSATSCGIDPDVEAARHLAARIVPEAAGSFRFVKTADSVDRFTLRSEGDKIVIAANNAGSMAVGLNYYLKRYCLTEVSWYAADPVELPAVLPAVEGEITAEARVDQRFFLNYCTSGYTMPFWKWSDWERFIDWMALNGVNLPLATTGQEAIWYNVWQKLGLTDQEIRSYFTGPAHLPWHRMCNIDGWQGPLPMEWLQQQADLQKRIVERERELSMRPVLPGFAGHIPEALARRYPEAATTTVSKWGGFPDENRCTYLSPTDTLFSTIQKLYLMEQTRLYGTDHVYGIDPFNEVDPPTWCADSLAEISRGIYESLAEVDPDAVWLQMAWILYNDSEHWTPEVAKAYLQGVPQGRMMLLDYYCDSTPEWKLFDSFYGQPYIWCYLGNFGGNTFVAGSLHEVTARIDDVLAHGGSNLCGIGSTLEGLDVNPYMYEYVLEQAWTLPDAHNIENIVDRRTGRIDARARKAWKLLVDSVMVAPGLCGQGTLTNARPTLEGTAWWTVRHGIAYDNAHLVEAWGELLQIDSCARDAYEFDCVNLGRQALSNYFAVLRDDFARAYHARDVAATDSIGRQMTELLADITTLLRGHRTFSMKKWITDATDCATDPADRDYYERNARTIITVWGPSKSLNDYANRQWAELTAGYYAPRWQMFVDRVKAATAAGDYDADEFFEASRRFENEWTDPAHTVEYLDPLPALPTARRMYEKYAPRIKSRRYGGQ